MQQNGVRLVEEVRITSEADRPLEDLVVTLELDNGEADAWTGRLSRIDPGATATLKAAEFALSAKALATRTEAERSAIVATVACTARNGSNARPTRDGANGGTDSSRTCRKSFPVTLLAFDEWPGVAHNPRCTAAFVTPNHSKVAELLHPARESLRSTGAPDSLEGYQSVSWRRASQIAEACFNAMAARGIGNLPGSYKP